MKDFKREPDESSDYYKESYDFLFETNDLGIIEYEPLNTYYIIRKNKDIAPYFMGTLEECRKKIEQLQEGLKE
jgi:hypothetical protein